MLKDKLEITQIACGQKNTCSVYKFTADLDEETREVFIETLLGPISTRTIHHVLQSEGHRVDRQKLAQQRRCMKTTACNCDWDKLS